MSYIRAGHPMKYVYGISQDYVYGTKDSDNGPGYIQDYGNITNAGLIEILCNHWITGNEYDDLLKWKIITYLAKILRVPLKDEYKVKNVQRG